MPLVSAVVFLKGAVRTHIRNGIEDGIVDMFRVFNNRRWKTVGGMTSHMHVVLTPL